MAENSLNDGGNLEDLRVEGGILNNKFGNLDIESD